MSNTTPAPTPENAREKPPEMDWQDPFLLRTQLHADEVLIMQSAHDYCQDKLAPPHHQRQPPWIFDRDIMTEMGARVFGGDYP